MTPPQLQSVLPAAINHLLAQEPWARDKLLPHAGKVACFDLGLLDVRLKVATDGLLLAVTEDAQASVTIRVKLSDLPLIAQNRERAFSYVKLEGDADFANTISQLSQTLRWEVAEDLSKWVGDIAATRMIATAKSAFESARSTQQSLTENIAEYLLEENPMLVRPQAVAEFASDVVKLRDDLERLTKRVEKMEERR